LLLTASRIAIYAHRLSLCGIPFHNAGRTGIQHLGSQSQTVPELRAQNQRTFAATAAYYKKKWGGLPGEETYTLPFNDPAFGWQIAASQRHDPYPGHLRTDLEEHPRRQFTAGTPIPKIVAANHPTNTMNFILSILMVSPSGPSKWILIRPAITSA
jgi:hypothetical protein